MTTAMLTEARSPKYSVKQAAELTGLTLNQVRLWERRYHLIAPQRAANGYRLYCEEDLDILRYALQETQKGVSIQLIAEQVKNHRDEILRHIYQQKAAAPVRISADDAFRVPHLEQLIKAIEAGDAVRFERLLLEAQAGRSLIESLRTIDLPVLAHIGELTVHGRIHLAASHLASAVIRRRIFSHIHNLGLPQWTPQVLLACAPDDYHELGLLCCLLELTQHMVPAAYFGANMPIAELELYARKLNPAAVLLSVVAPLLDSEAEKLVQRLKGGLCKIAPVAVGGYEAEKRRHLFEYAGIKVFRRVEDIMQWRFIRNLRRSN